MKHAGLFLLFSTFLGALLPALPASASDSTTDDKAATASVACPGRDPVKPVPWGKPRA
jgi:hypothetical protein